MQDDGSVTRRKTNVWSIDRDLTAFSTDSLTAANQNRTTTDFKILVNR
jgi:hypothetical protein